MIKLNILKKVGNIVDIGIFETENVTFARQLVEKGLAELIEGNIPEKEKRSVINGNNNNRRKASK